MAPPRDTAPGSTRPPLGPSLPAGRAFVVQLRADADLARGVVRGRVEHVVSGVAALFDSVEQLLARMRDAEAATDSMGVNPRSLEHVPTTDGRKEPAT